MSNDSVKANLCHSLIYSLWTEAQTNEWTDRQITIGCPLTLCGTITMYLQQIVFLFFLSNPFYMKYMYFKV